MHRHTEHQDSIDEQFDALLRKALQEYIQKQEAFTQVIASFSSWSLSEDTATLSFTGASVETRSFRVTPICSYLPESENLAWAWANDAFSESARSRSAKIRELTAKTGYQIFEIPHFRANANDIDELCALALQALGGVAVFKAKGETPWVYYVVE